MLICCVLFTLDCSNFEYDCKEGEKQSMSNPLKIIAGISQDQCSLECCKTDTCVGYNYGLDKTCVLSSELRSTTAPASSVGTKQCQRLGTSYIVIILYFILTIIITFS